MMHVLDMQYALHRSDISDNVTQAFDVYGGRYSQAVNPDDHGTSHISVVDAARGAVALTTTINTGFGSKVISNSTGLPWLLLCLLQFHAMFRFLDHTTDRLTCKWLQR